MQTRQLEQKWIYRPAKDAQGNEAIAQSTDDPKVIQLIRRPQPPRTQPKATVVAKAVA